MVEIEKGTILVYRAFDVASEIALDNVEESLKNAAKSSRLKLARTVRHAIVMRNPPISLNLSETEVFLGGEKRWVETQAKIWDYGVISITFHLPILPQTQWADLIQQAALIESEPSLDTAARARAEELANFLESSFKDPIKGEVFEDYVVFFFEKLNGIEKMSELIDKVDIPSLILGESSCDLAQFSRQSILENVFQYRSNDLAIIDWNSAVVVEPTGNRDVLDILEFALTHLLEMRFYDSLIDKRLAQLYDAMEEHRGHLLRSRFPELYREASTRYVEFTEFIERVGNSLKVVGDFYLAQIFRAASKRFRLWDWQESVSRKVNILAQVSELLQGEIDMRRSHLLELVIILLIVFEIVSTFLKLH